MTEPTHQIVEEQTAMSGQKWIKRGATAGFAFFLIKGLIWLGVFIAAAIGFL